MSFSEWIIDRTGRQTILYLNRSMVPNVDLACYRVSHAKNMGNWEMSRKVDIVQLQGPFSHLDLH